MIDDLQWGDEGTFSLLSHIARFVSEIPVLLVGTYRDSEFAQSSGLAAALYACTRLTLLKQINLPNLSESATAEMTAALCQQEPPREIRDLFYSGSEGNPFFVEELFRHLTERGNLFDSNGQFQRGMKLDRLDVPRNVRMIIDRRLARLGVEPRKMLDTAAVIGRAFTFDLLEAATEIDTDKLLDFVEEAEELGYIVDLRISASAFSVFSRSYSAVCPRRSPGPSPPAPASADRQYDRTPGLASARRQDQRSRLSHVAGGLVSGTGQNDRVPADGCAAGARAKRQRYGARTSQECVRVTRSNAGHQGTCATGTGIEYRISAGTQHHQPLDYIGGGDAVCESARTV